MKNQPLIELRRVHKAYREANRERIIFCDVNESFREGEFVVLLGRSGSGKSTLLNLVSGIDPPDRGDILIQGINLARLSEHNRTLFRRKHIGFVFQSFNLIPTLSVEENLLLPLELNRSCNPDTRRRAARLLEQLELSGRSNSFPDRLSGGERQRVAIARALVHDPNLILADEPTGNLDLETGRGVLDRLDQLVREAEKTLLMVTHSREVIGLADRILTIQEGQLREIKPDR